MATCDHITSAPADDILSHILNNSDLIGHTPDGGAFLLLAVDRAALERLEAFGTDDAEAEDADPPEGTGDELDGYPSEDEHEPELYNMRRRPPLSRFGGWEATDRPGIVRNTDSAELWNLNTGGPA